MFYETSDHHGLAHDPFKAIVAPRPIGWIGTRSADGSENLAPYSFFNAISDNPKMVMFSSSGRKDSVRNIEETGVFTASLTTRHLAEAVNLSSIDAPHGESEFSIAGLTPVRGRLVDAPYVGEAHAALECKATDIYRPKAQDGSLSANYVIFGQVLGIHIADEMIVDGMLDRSRIGTISRLGYLDYAEIDELFQMVRPKYEK